MNKYEQLIEYIINEQEDKARELFHQIVVEKSRDIYESIIDEEDFEENIGGSQVDKLVDEIEADESGMQEADEDVLGMDNDDMDSDMPAGDMDSDMGDDMDSGMEDSGVEEKIQDLETALDALKAEFDALMGGSDDMGDVEDDMDDLDVSDDMDDDSDVEFDMDDESEPKEEGMVREYVEKVPHPSMNTEGGAVGAKGEGTTVNKQSIVAGKNNMGGSTANIVKGGTEQAADGKPTPTPNNQYTKGRGDLKGAGSFENVPGAKTKGYTNRATSYEKQHGKEGQTTDGKMGVETGSIVGGKVR
jgi:hypothetical protein